MSGKKIIILWALALIIFTTVASTAQNRADERVIIENRTASLNVVFVEEDQSKKGNLRRFNYSVQNNYIKPVASFYYEVKNEATGGTYLVKEGTLDLRLALKSGGSANGLFLSSAQDKSIWTLLAVIFADGSTDGDPAAAKRLQEESWGTALAYEEIIPLWRDALKEPDLVRSLAGIRSFRKTLDALVPRPSSSKGLNSGFKSGQHSSSSTVFALERSMVNGKDPDVIKILTDKLTEMEVNLKQRKETLGKLFETDINN